jgi:hypothetical protein
MYHGIQGAHEIRPLYITVALSLSQNRHVILLVWLRETRWRMKTVEIVMSHDDQVETVTIQKHNQTKRKR